MNIFRRNLTSELIENACRSLLLSKKSGLHILELGCGDGNISRSLANDFSDNFYYASDISIKAIEKAIELSKIENLNNIEFKVSNGFEAWENSTFDIIICDISAINQTIAELSNWYNGIECNTGNCGLKSVIPIINDINKYLNFNGNFLLPIISLSNTLKLQKLINLKFSEANIAISQDWPLPKELAAMIKNSHIPNEGADWNIRSKFGIDIANTGVIICKL